VALQFDLAVSSCFAAFARVERVAEIERRSAVDLTVLRAVALVGGAAVAASCRFPPRPPAVF
jgi:hypothetical protein